MLYASGSMQTGKWSRAQCFNSAQNPTVSGRSARELHEQLATDLLLTAPPYDFSRRDLRLRETLLVYFVGNKSRGRPTGSMRMYRLVALNLFQLAGHDEKQACELVSEWLSYRGYTIKAETVRKDCDWWTEKHATNPARYPAMEELVCFVCILHTYIPS